MTEITIHINQIYRECSDLMNYDLEIFMDGKPTNICIQASSGGGSVEGQICFLPRGYEGYEEMLVSRSKTINLSGDIRHLKKFIIENLDDILEFIMEDLLVLQVKVNESYKIVKAYLSKKEEQPTPDDQTVECEESSTGKHVPGEVYGPSSIDGKFRRRCQCCGKVVAT